MLAGVKTRKEAFIMRRLLLSFFAAVGLAGFAASAQADCNNMNEPLKTADAGSTTVATGTPATPLPTPQSDG